MSLIVLSAPSTACTEQQMPDCSRWVRGLSSTSRHAGCSAWKATSLCLELFSFQVYLLPEGVQIHFLLLEWALTSLCIPVFQCVGQLEGPGAQCLSSAKTVRSSNFLWGTLWARALNYGASIFCPRRVCCLLGCLPDRLDSV